MEHETKPRKQLAKVDSTNYFTALAAIYIHRPDKFTKFISYLDYWTSGHWFAPIFVDETK